MKKVVVINDTKNLTMVMGMFHGEQSIISEHYGFSNALIDNEGLTVEKLEAGKKALADSESKIVKHAFYGIDMSAEGYDRACCSLCGEPIPSNDLAEIHAGKCPGMMCDCESFESCYREKCTCFCHRS